MTAPGRLTVADARRIGQGSAHLDADPTYARWLVRRISPFVSWAVVRWTPLSADAVTSLSIVSGVVGGLLTGVGTAGTYVAAVVLLQLAYLLDVADGEVARIRGTAGRRGTYLDLIGHFLQNRALYAGASLSLVAVTGGALWAILVALRAILVALLVMGFSMPFGLYARSQVVPAAVAEAADDHRPRGVVAAPRGRGAVAWLGYAYRRLAFLWNYPASMNLFSAAIVVDAIRLAAGAPAPLAVPALIALFGTTLAAKQIAHALRLLGRDDW